jgi:Na+/melibiose symporter-like transporter
MIHPLFRLIVSDPQLLAEHVEAYSELVAEEVGAVTSQWTKRAVLHAISLVGALVATVLIGVAVMLWAAVPTDNMNAPWALIVVPGVPLVLAVWAHFAAKAPMAEHGFKAIREQLAADAAMLRSVTAP